MTYAFCSSCMIDHKRVYLKGNEILMRGQYGFLEAQLSTFILPQSRSRSRGIENMQ
jgi:hypothetical protein